MSFDPLNWGDILDNNGNTVAPISAAPNQLLFPPSPDSSVSLSPIQLPPRNSFDEFFPGSSEEPLFDPQIDAKPVGYPSPASPLAKVEDSDDSASPSQQVTTPPMLIRRRGPGRPSKAQLAAMGIENRPSGRSLITMRRQIHNDSAMRSRAKFNTVLEELWNVVPRGERQIAISSSDPSRQICRAEKMEIVIAYVRRLQKNVKIQGKCMH